MVLTNTPHRFKSELSQFFKQEAQASWMYQLTKTTNKALTTILLFTRNSSSRIITNYKQNKGHKKTKQVEETGVYFSISEYGLQRKWIDRGK